MGRLSRAALAPSLSSWLTVVAAAALPACGGVTYYMAPGDLEVVHVPPDTPPPGTYISDLRPSTRVRACWQHGYGDADQVTCLEASGDEEALPALLILGIRDEVLDQYPTTYPSPFHDSVSAADAAGRLAAKTSPRELYAMTKDASFPIEGFAANALTTYLAALASTPGAAPPATIADTAHACAPLLASTEGRVAMSAALCVAAAKEPATMTALLQAFVTRTDATFKAQVGPAVTPLPAGTLDDTTLRALGDFIKSALPDPYNSADGDARDQACAVLAAQASPAPDWAVEAARVAWVAVQQKSGGASGITHCGDLGKMTGPNAPQ